MRRSLNALLLAVSLLALLLPGSAKAQEDDGKTTSNNGAVSTDTCPGGNCSTQALGTSSEGLTASGALNGDRAPDPPCTGTACGQLPSNGDLGGITRICDPTTETCSEPPPTTGDNGGITQLPSGSGTKRLGIDLKAAVAVPAGNTVVSGTQAAIDMPMPVPHTSTPRSASPRAMVRPA